MKRSEVCMGMIVEVRNPSIYFIGGNLINGRSVVMVTQKYDISCSVAVCRRAKHGLSSTCILRDIPYEDLIEYKTHGTKWWK